MIIVSFGFFLLFYSLSGSDDKTVELDDIYSQFSSDNCPKLVEKPKMFWIAACRGGWFYFISNLHSLSPVFLVDAFFVQGFLRPAINDGRDRSPMIDM